MRLKSATWPGSSTSTEASVPGETIRSPTKASVAIEADAASDVASTIGAAERRE